MTERIVTELGVQARGIAQQHNAYEAALADKKAASTDMLAAVVDAIKPALRALSSKIITARVMSRSGGRTEKDGIGVPGLYLASIGPDVGPGPKTHAGSWQGTDLFVLTDGSFVLLSYEGTHAEDVSEWSAAAVPLTARDVIDMFPIDIILDRIAKAMVEQAGSPRTVMVGKEKRIKEIVEQAGRIRALITLVRSSL